MKNAECMIFIVNMRILRQMRSRDDIDSAYDFPNFLGCSKTATCLCIFIPKLATLSQISWGGSFASLERPLKHVRRRYGRSRKPQDVPERFRTLQEASGSCACCDFGRPGAAGADIRPDHDKAVCRHILTKWAPI